MGTIAFPDAPLKIFLTASLSIRAHRLWLKLQEAGRALPLEEVIADLTTRDRRDEERAYAPLRPAHDAVHVENSQMNADQVAGTIQLAWETLVRHAKKE